VAEAVNETAEQGREPERAGAPLTVATHGGRFTLAYLAIMIVFAGLVGLFAYMIGRSDSEPWSPFKPKGEGLARATNIANRVAPRYVHEGRPIAFVEAQPPLVGNTAIDVIAVARNTSQGVGGGFRQVQLQPASNTLLYVFCGSGQDCSIPGQPSVERGRLLRRESLELALYTFKYFDNIDSVVTLLPPRGNVIPAVWLRKPALNNLLDRPLKETLPGNPPFRAESLVDGETVERLTAHRFFPSYFQPLPNGRLMLRLGGPPPEQPSQSQSTAPSR
jgi:hypothetical protein